MQINRHGTGAIAPLNRYNPWYAHNIVLDVYSASAREGMTLGQFRSLIEGLGLYMIKGKRSREARFLLSKEGELFLTNLAGGDIWSI